MLRNLLVGWSDLVSKIPIYECHNQIDYDAIQIIPLYIYQVKYVGFKSHKYPNGCIQIEYADYDDYAPYCTTGFLKCYVCGKGKYAIWGRHRFYEGYSGSIILKGLPYSENIINDIRKEAEKYGSIIE